MHVRRQVLKFGLAALGAAVLPSQVLADVAPRRLALNNLHTGEAIDAVYFEKGSYVPDAVEALDKVLRDFRTGDVRDMDRGLFDLLHNLKTKVESRRRSRSSRATARPRPTPPCTPRATASPPTTCTWTARRWTSAWRRPAAPPARRGAQPGKGGVGFYLSPTSVCRRWAASAAGRAPSVLAA